MSIEDYLTSKFPIMEDLLSVRPEQFTKVSYHMAIQLTILCYSEDSVLNSRFSDLDKKINFCEKDVGSRDVIDDEIGSMYLYCLESFLTRHVHSYKYEYLVTCHVVLCDNNKELRKPLINIKEEDKRAKVATLRSELLRQNKEIIEEIESLNKVIFGQNEELLKKGTKRMSLEDRVKTKNS